jgi:hypothetical protein
MDIDCATLVGTFPAARAKVSNNLYALPGFDGRSSIARRYRDVVRGLLADLGIGERELSEASKLQLRMAGLLQVRVERLQQRALSGEASFDLEFNLTRAQNGLARALRSLGLGHRRKRQTLSPEDPLTYAARLKAGA